jgi:uncharacterized protein (DUF1697 family)
MTHVALLRVVNLAGSNKAGMAALEQTLGRAAATRLGLKSRCPISSAT